MNPNAIDILMEELDTALHTVKKLTAQLDNLGQRRIPLTLVPESEAVVGLFLKSLKVGELRKVEGDTYRLTLPFSQPVPSELAGPLTQSQAIQKLSSLLGT